MVRSIVKVREVGGSIVITVPREIREELGWHTGDRVMITVQSRPTSGEKQMEVKKEH